MKHNLKAWAFRGRAGRFDVVAINLSVAFVIARAVDSMAAPVGVVSSLPGVSSHPCAVMTAPEVRRLAGSYPGYRTLGGPLPLAAFDPYGMSAPDGDRPAGVNWRPGMREWLGIVQQVDGRVYVGDAPLGPVHAPFMLGAFPLVTPAEYAEVR